MGALGLLDAPRSGRPKASEAAMSRLVAIAATPGGREVVVQHSAQLQKRHREALWREMRKAGNTLERDTRLARYALSAPGELLGIVGVLSLPGLVTLAFADRSDAARLPVTGSWATLLPRVIPQESDLDDASRFVLAVRASGRTFAHGGRTLSAIRVRDEVVPTFAAKVRNSLSRLRRPWCVTVLISERRGSVPVSLLPTVRAELSQPCGSGLISVIAYRHREAALVQALGFHSQAAQRSRAQATVAAALAREQFFCWFR